MKDEARKYLLDISEAIIHIDLHLGGIRDFTLFSENLRFSGRLSVNWKLLAKL